MQTRSDAGTRAEWAARTDKPPRSVFGNYRPGDEAAARSHAERQTEGRDLRTPAPAATCRGLQTDIELALARSFLYRLLAQAYEDPTEKGWTSLSFFREDESFPRAIQTCATLPPAGNLRHPAAPGAASLTALTEAAAAFQARLTPDGFQPFLAAYLEAFGHAARGRCPLNEIEYGDLKADPLFQPHRLADLAAFYRAFGLEVADDADERHDHLCLELEFMCVLTAKEAYALEHQIDPEELALCRDAQKKFLREHLGRWTPAFARRLARMAGDTALTALSHLTRAFIEIECARFGIAPGSEDLLLRPVDEAAESLCNSCGANRLHAGALESS